MGYLGGWVSCEGCLSVRAKPLGSSHLLCCAEGSQWGSPGYCWMRTGCLCCTAPKFCTMTSGSGPKVGGGRYCTDRCSKSHSLLPTTGSPWEEGHTLVHAACLHTCIHTGSLLRLLLLGAQPGVQCGYTLGEQAYSGVGEGSVDIGIPGPGVAQVPEAWPVVTGETQALGTFWVLTVQEDSRAEAPALLLIPAPTCSSEAKTNKTPTSQETALSC